MKMLKRWISVCLVVLLLAGVAFDHTSLIGSEVEAAELEESGEAAPEEAEAAAVPATATATAETAAPAADTPSVLSETTETYTELETTAPEEQQETYTETETPAPAEQPATNTDTETKATEEQAGTYTETEVKEPQKTETPAASTETPAQPSPYEGKYEDDTIIVSVSAEPGIVPEDAQLSVTPIEKTEITGDMTAEERAEAQKINDQYDLTEKKLTEDSEKNEETMEGFLAYDICFIVNGEEVEPTGDVKVIMDFKEAAIPEGVSEDAEVTVKHLKEDETAEDGVVVEDMAAKAEVQTTAQTEVKKVELTAESFSIFTIGWGTSSRSPELSVNVVNSSGNPIGQNGTYEFNYEKDKDRILVETIANQIKTGCYVTENFNKAVYIKEGNEFSFNATEVHGLYYNSETGFKYCKNEDITTGNGWSDIGEGKIYFIFGAAPEEGTQGWPGTVPTVSTKDEGIKINLFDYQVYPDGRESVDLSNSRDPGLSQGINADKVLKFVSSKGKDNKNINIWQRGSSGYLNQDMVLSNLGSDGYPVLNPTKEGNTGGAESLGYLFNTAGSENVKSVYQNLDYLFQKDSEGYYVYNSNTYYAYLSSLADEASFTAYDKPNIGFYPFTDPVYNKETMKAANDEKGEDAATLGSRNVNHYFGMTISAGFLQPAGGQIQQESGATSPMVFEFSGDDDVWVFIDDVLVLDLGGIHAAVSGKIDFSTGEVWTKDKGQTQYQPDGTILEKFRNAGKEDTQKFSDNTFANYTNHTIKFFYLERGNSESNCMIKFNLPTIPEDSVSVAKEVVDETGNSVDYARDIDFQFHIGKADENGTMQDYGNQSYTIYQGSMEIGAGETDVNGNFTLKHGQVAVFDGFQATDRYQVTETGAYLNGYRVEYNGNKIEVKGDGSEQTIYSATTGNLMAGDVKSVNFKNSVDKTATLTIKKQFSDGGGDTGKDFKIQVIFQGEPYSGGSYTKNGRLNYADANGMITLKAGETASISGLPYGTSFEILEELDGSYLPAYTVEGAAYEVKLPTNDEDNEVTSASGKIAGDANVTVTNDKVNVDSGTTELTVTKTWADGTTEEIKPERIQVTLYVDENNNGVKDEGDTKYGSSTITNPVDLTGENWTHTWTNLPADTNFVVEETPVEGFTSTTSQSSSFEFKYLDRTTSCSEILYDLGKNNMLLVKLTSNSGYILWTPIDLGLTEDEVNLIAETIQGMRLEGAGNLELGSLIYAHGEDSTYASGVHLTQSENGWKLKFDKKSNWAQFWNLQYDRTIQSGITNTPDTDKEVSITVNKQWMVEEDETLPESITVQLYYRDASGNEIAVEDKTLVIRKGADGNWTGTFENLDYYGQDASGNYFIYDYFVKESKIGDTDVDENGRAGGFQSSVSGNAEDGFTITNTKSKPWQIVKVSASDGGEQLKLEGAVFSLTEKTEQLEQPNVYYGKSEAETGIVKWYTDETCETGLEGFIPDGTYTFEEIKAPLGYLKSSVVWTIEIENGSPISVKIGEQEVTGQDGSEILTYSFENEALYDLPSAGGSGIYWYTIGGILLMIAGTLVLYKNKRREVLKRK